MENSAVEQQIADLERQIQEKKAILELTSPKMEKLPSDKEILHGVIGQKIQENAPQYFPKVQPITQSASVSDDTPSYMNPQLKDKVQELINVAFTKSIADAVKLAGDNSALLDAFHDVLVDELYSSLIERKTIASVK